MKPQSPSSVRKRIVTYEMPVLADGEGVGKTYRHIESAPQVPSTTSSIWGLVDQTA